LWVLSMELALRHPSDAYNLEVAPKFLENLSTLESGNLKFVYMKLLERPLKVQRQVHKQPPSATVDPYSLEGSFCIMISLYT